MLTTVLGKIYLSVSLIVFCCFIRNIYLGYTISKNIISKRGKSFVEIKTIEIIQLLPMYFLLGIFSFIPVINLVYFFSYAFNSNEILFSTVEKVCGNYGVNVSKADFENYLAGES